MYRITIPILAALWLASPTAAQFLEGGGPDTTTATAKGGSADRIHPGETRSLNGVTIANSENSAGPVVAFRFIRGDGSAFWRTIDIGPGERAIVDIGAEAPAADLLKMRVLVRETARLRLTGPTTDPPRTLGQYDPEEPSESSGVILSGVGLDVEDAQVLIQRSHTVLRTEDSSQLCTVGFEEGNITVLLCASVDFLHFEQGPVELVQF